MRNLLLVLSLVFLVQARSVMAQSNGGSGGGDECERRIKSIRNDIKEWIDSGNSVDLKFPAGQSNAEFVSKMTQILEDGVVQINCIKENPDNQFMPVWIRNPVTQEKIAKTCKFESVSATRRQASITCDYDRFMWNGLDDKNESKQSALAKGQTKIIFHEFASLAGLEIPDYSDSDYHLSDQIVGFVGAELVWHLLGVRERPLEYDLPNRCLRRE